ncbi:MAG: TetR family transcriptional regulator C-terminal domain-containing protein [Pseudonocardia sp.]|nr:TetR family transcriptional regulator C-terminal domain-containing protein [Pseudonocardia sp.]
MARTGRASIYATFGNKRELYLRALDRYAEMKDLPLHEELTRPGAAPSAVRALIRRDAAEAGSEGRADGCFVTNTAVEVAAHDRDAARRVEASWDGIEALLCSALVRAETQGELAEGRDPRALARMLIVLMQGMRVVGKVCADPARVRDAAEQALSLLD